MISSNLSENEVSPGSGLEPGSVVLKKYRVERIVGRGGMGCVLAVRHVDLGELFAMKVLLPEIAQRPGAVERFVREARAAARLKSDHVVRVMDVGELESGAPYLLMEYLEGKDLATLVEERGTLSPRQVVDFTLEALDAIAEAHARGIIHRDLKPSNLFVSVRRDQRLLLKVLDFGISKELNPKDQATTHSAGLMGSPYYMSPEHMRSAKRVDARTDIWSLGIIMYELLSGTIPFDGETPTEVCSAVLEQPLPSLVERAPHVPLELVAIVEKCLRRAPEERYATSSELSDALKQVSDELVEAPRSLLASGSWLQARVSLPSIPRDITPSALASRSSRTSGIGPRRYGEDLPTLPPPADRDAPTHPEAASHRSSSSAPPASAGPSLRAPSLDTDMTAAPPAAARSRVWMAIALGVVLAGGTLTWFTVRKSAEPADGKAHTETTSAPSARPAAAPAQPTGEPASAAPMSSATASATGTQPSSAPLRPSTTPTNLGTPSRPPQAQTNSQTSPPPTTPAPNDPGPTLKKPKF